MPNNKLRSDTRDIITSPGRQLNDRHQPICPILHIQRLSLPGVQQLCQRETKVFDLLLSSNTTRVFDLERESDATGIHNLSAEDSQERPYNLLEEGQPIKALFV
jgi:hypothetical protein